jgi:hypothetical protein
MEEYNQLYTAKNLSNLVDTFVTPVTPSDFDNLYELNTNILSLLEDTLKQSKPDKQVIDLCDKSLTKILQANGLYVRVTK